jgi:FkbM family methyltransferase
MPGVEWLRRVPNEDTKAQSPPKSCLKSIICMPASLSKESMSGFYSNAFKVGIGLTANLGRFDGWGSRAIFLWSTLRHALVIALKIPLKPKVRTLRFSGLTIEYKEFTGELGNIKTVFFDEDEDLPLPPTGAVVLDVGANIGLFTLFLIWKYGRGRFATIHLFEPNPETFGRLRRNLSANGLDDLCKAHLLALSDRAGTIYMESPHGYSVLNMISDTGTVPVECKPLDDWRGEQRLDAMDLLKVDVEGHEMSLLRGALGTLPVVRRLYVEVKGEHLDEFLAVTRSAGFVEEARQSLFTGDAMLLLKTMGADS